MNRGQRMFLGDTIKIQVCPYRLRECRRPAGNSCPVKIPNEGFCSVREYITETNKADKCKHKGRDLTMKQ